jgi:chaperonin GroEL (HSP60 family)
MPYGVSNEKLEDLKMGLNLVDGKEYKETLTGISYLVADVLVKTLGPYASTTTIDDGTYTYPTKDGWSVLNRLRFGSAIEDTMLKFIKQISFNLNSRVGDGTTTAVIAANHFIELLQQLMKNLAVEHGMIIRQADLLDQIDSCTKEIIEELHSPERLHMITQDENGEYPDIYKIAYVSTNRNATIANMIKEIYDKTGNPNIHVTINGNGDTYTEIQKGYRIDAKLLFPECYTNTEDKTCVSNDDNYTFIFNNNISYAEHMGIINACIRIGNASQKPIIIMAPYYDEIITSVMSGTVHKCFNGGQIPSVQFVQIPLSTSLQKNLIEDFTVLTGGQIISYDKVKMFNQLAKQQLKAEGEEVNEMGDEYKGLLNNFNYEKPQDVLDECMGVVHKVTSSEKYIMIEGFSTESPAYKAAKTKIEEEYEEAKKSNIDKLNKDFLNANLRRIKFYGDTGIIHVGGDSDLVRQCTKDSVDDAVLACRSAFENGYIRGLNMETISVAAILYSKYFSMAIRPKNDSTSISNANSYDIIDTNSFLKACIFNTIVGTFAATSKDVMRNKYINNDFGFTITDDNYTWSVANLTMDDVIATCITKNFCFDIVTEVFEPAGQSLVNSVATDCEILSAMTSILSLLLSSNQLLSINKVYDRQRGRAQVIKDKQEEIGAITQTITDVLAANGCMFFDDFDEEIDDEAIDYTEEGPSPDPTYEPHADLVNHPIQFINNQLTNKK